MAKFKDIQLLRTTYLRGPSVWTYRPVLEVWLDLGELEDYPSNKLPGFNERLTAWLPDLVEHHCGVGERGGFIQRLEGGTWCGHVLEHIIIELLNLAGMPAEFGQTREISQRGIYRMVFRCPEETVARTALAYGHRLIMAAINDEPFDLKAAVKAIKTEINDRYLGPSTGCIVDAAGERRIPHIRLNDGNLVQLGYGAAQRRIWTAETDRTSAIAEGIASDKDLTKFLLKSCGVPVPEGSLVRSAEAAWEEAQDIGVPVVVKPYDGNHGRGVSLNLMTESDVKAAYELAARKGDSSAVLVESFITGDEHRLLVVGNKLIAAAKGESLWVDGDGVSTVLELVNTQINIDPRRGEGEDFPLGTVKPHESGEIVLELQRQGMTALSVPQAGQKVLIQPNGNVAIDVTDDVHPSVVHAALLAARVVGLDIAGIDLVTKDITRPLEEQRGAIIEVNASPGLLAHIKPGVGQPRPVGAAIVDHLFAAEETGRIPLIGVTGTRGTSLIVRMLCKLLNLSGLHTGAVCSEGMYLDQRRVVSSDCVNWDAGQRLLLNRTVQTALFESNPRMILAEGLAYDKCQIGVVTDMGSLESVKDFDVLDEAGLYKVVRSQVDVVVPTGVAVLHAAHPQVLELADLCDGTVTLYAQDGGLPALAAQLAAGQRAVFVRGNHIVLAEGAIETVLLCLDLLKPATAGNVDSVLAVAAAAWALNLPVDLICAGLRTFDAAPGCIGN